MMLSILSSDEKLEGRPGFEAIVPSLDEEVSLT